MKSIDNDVAGIILVGGASRRLGRDKAMLAFQGVPAVERIIGTLRPLVSQIWLVGGEDRFPDVDAIWIPDSVAGAGPLGGIISGLAATGAEWNLVLACDTPLVSRTVLRRLLEARSPACDAVVPRHRKGIEPLVALYARRALQPMSSALEREELALHRVLEGMRVTVLDEASLGDTDGDLDSFTNVNTPDDVERVKAKLTAWRGNATL